MTDMTMEIAAAFLLSYTAWAAFALAMRKHSRRVWSDASTPLRRETRMASRLVGAVCLALSFIACVSQWGWAGGSVAWFGVLTATALGFVFLLAYAPRLAAGTAGATLLASPAAFYIM
ncbi:MAG: DUF3325 domain-containing protein [Rhodospirillales bacterium]